MQDYVFIPFPSLKLRYIFRQTKSLMKEEEDNDQDDDKVQEEEDVNEGAEAEAGWSKGECESEKEQPPEGEEIGVGEGEEVDRSEGAGRSEGGSNIGDGDFTVHRAPFSDFPLLKHHSHPFFVIVNAMSKLDWDSLTPQQQILFNLMQLNGRDDWIKRLHNREPPRDAGLMMNLLMIMATTATVTVTVASNANINVPRHPKPPL